MTTLERGEFAAYWPIVLTALVGIALGLGSIPFYTIGIFAPALAREFGWSMGDIMLGLSILAASMIVVGPVVGRLADRYGARRLTLGSIVLYGISISSFAVNRGSLPLYYLSWTAMSVFGVGTTAITYTRVLNGWFTVRRGLALGIALAGSGVFGMVGKPLTNMLVTNYSWRVGFCVLGALPIVFALPLAIAFLRDPAAPEEQLQQSPQKLSGVLFQWRFWLIALVYCLAGAIIGGVAVSLEIILAQKGFSHLDVLKITPILGFAIIVGRLSTGVLLDRFSVLSIAILQMLITALFCIALAQHRLSAPWAIAAIMGAGLSGGATHALQSLMTLRYFGMANYSAVFGALLSFATAGPAIGGLILALSFDRLGTYTPTFWAAAAISVISAAILMVQDRAWSDANHHSLLVNQ